VTFEASLEKLLELERAPLKHHELGARRSVRDNLPSRFSDRNVAGEVSTASDG
jgi:hypothetical protein